MAAAALGSRVSLVGAVGDDTAGDAGLEQLRSRGVGVSSVRVLDATPTGSAVILVADDGENVIVVDPGANAALDPEWVRRQVGTLDADVVLAQLEIPVRSLLAAGEAPPPLLRAEPGTDAGRRRGAARAAGQDGCARPQPARARPARPPARADVAGRGRQVRPCPGLRGNARRDPRPGRGRGVRPRGADRLVVVPATAVEVVDTSGAGDAFCGVLADRLARGDTIVEAATRATGLAGRSTTFPGAQVPRAWAEERSSTV